MDSAGNVYVSNSDVIYKITPADVVTVLTDTVHNATGLTVDASDNVFVAADYGQTVKKVTAAGVVTTVAVVDPMGNPVVFDSVSGLAFDADGILYLTDYYRILKVTPSGVATALAGSPTGAYGSADGTGSDAQFSGACALALDAAGNVFVAETNNNTIRKVTPGGVVTTLAGSATVEAGFIDATGSEAAFSNPSGIAVDSVGNVLVSDTGNSAIRQVTPAGVVTTVAGGTVGTADGTGVAAQFSGPYGIALSSAGLYIADYENGTVRRMDAGGVVTTFAGKAPHPGFANGTGTAAQFHTPDGLAVDSAGNIYIADSANNEIRKSTPEGVVTTLAGSLMPGASDGFGTSASFNNPQGIAVDAAGTVYVADARNYKIRKITPAGDVTTLAGTGSYGLADGTGTAAEFAFPRDLTLDSAGNIYVADNRRIRMITPAGVVTTLAGSPTGDYGYADGTGTAALFGEADGLAVDAAGNIFVADRQNNRIRKVTQAGVVTTFAGGGSTVNGIGTDAFIEQPIKIEVDADGTLYVTSSSAGQVFKITASAVVSTIGGTFRASTTAEGVGTAALFGEPRGIALSDDGILYVTSSAENVLMKGVSFLVPDPPTPPTTPTIAPAVVPTIASKGSTKLTTGSSKVKIKGTSSSSVVRIEYKVGKKGKLHSVATGASWALKVKGLEDGKNAVYVRGVTATGVTTAFKKYKVTRD